MTPAEFEQLTKEAAFGRACLDLAKDHGFVPKRIKTKTRIVEKVKIVCRRPRRTKAQIAADAQQPGPMSLSPLE